ncbi:uncharacterized protein LOC119276168 [Triticum dicoccoides]|uniref:uncharacterized protein LOC119276168 n=1 Tax=Triticum dicoccoides TaxID=85692 RepID=UPI000E7A2457|nr:uncharacterized protein LOC119276168 [Triticum dicoccoides]
MAAISAAISGWCSSSCLSQFQRGLPSPARRRHFKVTAMAPKNKVNKYDDGWSKQWFGAGIFAEGSEEASVDVFKKLEKRKVLSSVEKAGLLSKAEELGVTLSSLEKLGLLSKAEDLGLLSLVESAATVSPAVLASLSLPLLVASIATVVFVPDDSTLLVTVQTVVATLFAAVAAGLFVGSVVLDGLQDD